MKRSQRILISVVLVLTAAVISSLLTMRLCRFPVNTDPVEAKVEEISAYLDAYFIDEYDPDAVIAAAADGAAEAMIEATGDRWSYYISAEDMVAYEEQMENAYVGVGVTIQLVEQGVEIVEVTEGGPADQAGLLPGDIVTHVDGQSTAELGISVTQNVVRGEAGTQVRFTVLRGSETLELDLTREKILSVVAEGRMLEDGIGYIYITDFDEHCAEQTLEWVDRLVEQGARALVFDVRFNGGGLKTEMVKILDALLPEGPLFRSVDYAGNEELTESDAAYLDLPMAVLVNEESYSAAEFFAAALQEYEAAVVVGVQTSGKGNFQYTIPLSDGSAVALSVGKYYTPKGVSLSGVGITPDVEADLDDEAFTALYYGTLEQADDVQLLAALEALRAKIS